MIERLTMARTGRMPKGRACGGTWKRQEQEDVIWWAADGIAYARCCSPALFCAHVEVYEHCPRAVADEALDWLLQRGKFARLK